MDQITEQTAPQTQVPIPPTLVPPAPINTTEPITPKQPSQNYFSRLYSGRMNRKNFIIGILLLLCVPLVLLLLDFTISLTLHFVFPLTPITNLSINPGEPLPNQGSGNVVNSILTIVFTFLTIVWLIFFIINYFSFLVRRLHDLNKNGLLCLLSFVPVLNLLLDIYLLFFPGTVGEKKYGTQPLPRINIKQDFLKFS